jgi:S-adenosylmethionine:tRNA ribosyltransferase-isomerase
VSALAFDLPRALEATEPPEARGLDRDGVRLLVAQADGGVFHTRFSALPTLLRPGDLIVVNVSATLPASVPGRRQDGGLVRVQLATRAPELDDRWRVVELRTPDGGRPARGRAGETIALGRSQVELELVAPYASGPRLLLARLNGEVAVETLLAAEGEPIRYGYAAGRWPLAAYQNVYAISPGSAEMPSAGRPFTEGLITAVVARGISVAPITLHTGVSSLERDEPPFPEQYEVPAHTARQIALTRDSGGRVIAVGTTVVRALETVADADGRVAPGSGWTGLVIGPERGVRAVDGIITGWHEPQASHLQMLAAIAGEEMLDRSYRAALRHGYRWHEFGDSHLILRR